MGDEKSGLAPAQNRAGEAAGAMTSLGAKKKHGCVPKTCKYVWGVWGGRRRLRWQLCPQRHWCSPGIGCGRANFRLNAKRVAVAPGAGMQSSRLCFMPEKESVRK